MFREKLPRVYELRDLIQNPASPNAYFQDFDNSLRDNCVKKKVFTDIERYFRGLDSDSWGFFKSEIESILDKKDPERAWQQIFDRINEIKAYNYLVSIGCTGVNFICRSKEDKKTPDLEGFHESGRVLCEVKTLNISKKEVQSRRNSTGREVLSQLEENFFVKKLRPTLEKAKCQIKNHDSDHKARWIIYVVNNFDDVFEEYQDNYFQQVMQYFLTSPMPDLEIVFYRRPCFYYANLESDENTPPIVITG